MSRETRPGRWHDREFVRNWDRRPTNRLKAEQLDILAAVIKENWRKGAHILDLGCGTGKTEARILTQLPAARFVCVDRSEVMLQLARRRLAARAGRCRFIAHDLDRIEALRLPERSFRFIVLVDVVHELTHPAKCRLLRYCRAHLAQRGLLLILDRIAPDLVHLRSAHAGVLHRLQQVVGSSSGQMSESFVDPRRHDHEHPLALEPCLRMLRTTGLVPAVLHLHFHKALIAATPAPD